MVKNNGYKNGLMAIAFTTNPFHCGNVSFGV